MSPTARTLLTGSLLALIATPILAQREPREGNQDKKLSRSCSREVLQVCGSEPTSVKQCLRTYSSALSNSCQKQVRKRIDLKEKNPAPRRTFVPTLRPTRSVLFGSHQRQRIDIFEPEGAVEPLPLVLFIHGGGWSVGSHTNVQSKPLYYRKRDIYFASTGYRLLPDTPVEDQARDVGAAIRALVGQANFLGFDPSRVVLMGHSSGAHLAALVAADPQYAGEAFGSIKGAVLLDGAAYDVAQIMEDAPFVAKRVYEDAFGFDADRQKALSPLTHIGGADAPHWLALYDENRDVAKKQVDQLTAALTASGRSAQAVAIPDTDHTRMNRDIGTPKGQAQTQAIDAFLERAFAIADEPDEAAS